MQKTIKKPWPFSKWVSFCKINLFNLSSISWANNEK